MLKKFSTKTKNALAAKTGAKTQLHGTTLVTGRKFPGISVIRYRGWAGPLIAVC